MFPKKSGLMSMKFKWIVPIFAIVFLVLSSTINTPSSLEVIPEVAVESSRMVLAVVRQPINFDKSDVFLVGLDAPDATVPLNSRIRLLVYVVKIGEPQVFPFAKVDLRITKFSLGINGRSVEVASSVEEYSPSMLVYSLSGFPLTKKGNNAVTLNIDYQLVGSLGLLHIPVSGGTTVLRYGIDAR